MERSFERQAPAAYIGRTQSGQEYERPTIIVLVGVITGQSQYGLSSMNRRQFLILGGLSTAGVFAGSAAFRVGTVWWDQTPSPDYQVLSAHEVQISEAIIDAMFPGDHLGMPNGNDVDVVDTLDSYLQAIGPHKSNLVRLLLHAIDDMAVLSDFGMTRFHRRSRSERVDILNAWDTSRIGPRREAFMSIKLIFSMGYCESPQVLRAADIEYECGVWQ